MDGAQFRSVVGFLGRPTTTVRRVDAMGHLQKSAGGLFGASVVGL